MHRCYITICIYSSMHDPDSVTSTLDLSPDRVVRKGEVRLGNPVPQSGWFLSSQYEVESENLGQHVNFIYEIFQTKFGLLDDLREDGHTIRLSFFLESSENNGGLVFAKEDIAQISAFKADLDLDYWCGDGGS